MPARLQRLIRERVMPTIEDWTHVAWRERSEIPDTFLWFSDPAQGGAPNCDNVIGFWAACALEDAVTMKPTHRSGIPYPDEMWYERALHEALHALFRAKHSEEGLMCINADCYRPISADGVRWSRGLRLRPLDHEVYALYGNPALRDGMTLAEVARIVQVR